jgi:hypothetical protein
MCESCQEWPEYRKALRSKQEYRKKERQEWTVKAGNKETRMLRIQAGIQQERKTGKDD